MVAAKIYEQIISKEQKMSAQLFKLPSQPYLLGYAVIYLIQHTHS